MRVREHLVAHNVLARVDMFQIAVAVEDERTRYMHSEVMAGQQSTCFGKSHGVVFALKRSAGGNLFLAEIRKNVRCRAGHQKVWSRRRGAEMPDVDFTVIFSGWRFDAISAARLQRSAFSFCHLQR